ncbi:MAG: methylated-DNA--[protein]-cysteine S-methyltransferase [Desulfobacterales bacterium]
MSLIYFDYYDSPIGLIEIAGTSTAVIALNFVAERCREVASHSLVAGAVRQLNEYFDGKRRIFNIEMALEGTEFQQQVWQQLQTVPYGCVASYQDIARGVGRPAAVRAVGAANGRNPIAIMVPCHRIIGKNGHLVGYGSGLWRKEWLLKHEGYPVSEVCR